MQRIIQRFRGCGKTCSEWRFGIKEIPTGLPIADPHTNDELQGNLLRDYERKFGQLREDLKLSKLCSDAGLKIVEKRHFFITLDEEERPDEMKSICREKTLPRNEEVSWERRWILRNTKNWPGLGCSLHWKSRIACPFWDFTPETFLLGSIHFWLFWMCFAHISDVTDVLGGVFRQQCTVLQCRINEITSWMSLNCSEIQEVLGGVRVHAILKPFLSSPDKLSNRQLAIAR